MTVGARVRVEFDPRIHDSAFLEEIDLYSELMIVAASSAGTLSTEVIDHALGLSTVLTVPDDNGRLTILAG